MGAWEENKEARVAAPQGEENTVVTKVCSVGVRSPRILKGHSKKSRFYFWQKENAAGPSYVPLPS